MTSFEIDLIKVISKYGEMDQIIETLSLCQSCVDSVRTGLGFDLMSKQLISGQLDNIIMSISSENQAVSTMKDRLFHFVRMYRANEENVYYNKNGNLAIDAAMEAILTTTPWMTTGNAYEPVFSLVDALGLMIHSTVLPTSLIGVYTLFDNYVGKTSAQAGLNDTFVYETEQNILTKAEYEPEKVNKSISDFLKKKGLLDEESIGGYYDKDGNFHKYDSENENQKEDVEKIGNLTLYEQKVSASAVGKKVSAETEYASGEASVNLLKAEAYANAYGGLYSVGPDGKKQLMLGLGGTLGASVTAFEVEAQGEIGTELFGAYGEASASAGKLGAEISGDAALFDMDGNFNPKLKVGASAEAIVAEASVSGGLKVAGTKVGGEASVNFGVGAHADVGYSDGKISLDVGASLGVGVGVSVEVDISGTVDAVCGWAESAWNEMSGWFAW